MVRRHYLTTYRPIDYVFDFERRPDGSYRIYIVWQPPYSGRPTGMHPTHRLGRPGRWYICWDTPIRSMGDARTIASEWANRTQRYIATGTPIESSW